MRKPLSFLFIGIGAVAIVLLGYYLFATFDNAVGDANDMDKKIPLKVTRKVSMHIGNSESKRGSALPVNVTQSVHLNEPVSEIRFWDIVPDWKQQDSAERLMRVTNISGNDVTDSSRIIVNPSILNTLEAVCPSGESRIAKFGYPFVIPLKDGTSGDLIISYNLASVVPENKTDYHIKFSSFYETDVRLPDNAVVESDNSQPCTIEYKEFPKVYMYDIKFSLQ